jgi:hypothetical protein
VLVSADLTGGSISSYNASNTLSQIWELDVIPFGEKARAPKSAGLWPIKVATWQPFLIEYRALKEQPYDARLRKARSRPLYTWPESARPPLSVGLSLTLLCQPTCHPYLSPLSACHPVTLLATERKYNVFLDRLNIVHPKCKHWNDGKQGTHRKRRVSSPFVRPWEVAVGFGHGGFDYHLNGHHISRFFHQLGRLDSQREKAEGRNEYESPRRKDRLLAFKKIQINGKREKRKRDVHRGQWKIRIGNRTSSWGESRGYD